MPTVWSLIGCALLGVVGCFNPCAKFDCSKCNERGDEVECLELVKLNDKSVCKTVLESGELDLCR